MSTDRPLHPGDTARLFVAVGLPDPVAEVVAALPRPEMTGVRWTRAAQWHVTLRFLGRESPAAVAAALRSLDHAPVRAELAAGVTTLGRGVLCVRVDGLDELAAAVRDRTRHLGEPPEGRGFVGHVTLARVSKYALAGRRASGLVGSPVPSAGWDVREVELMRSDLDPDGARYTALERVALRT